MSGRPSSLSPDVPEIGSLINPKIAKLRNEFEVELTGGDGETVEMSWDFVRAYCRAL